MLKSTHENKATAFFSVSTARSLGPKLHLRISGRSLELVLARRRKYLDRNKANVKFLSNGSFQRGDKLRAVGELSWELQFIHYPNFCMLFALLKLF